MTHQLSKELKRLNYLLGEINAAYHEMARKFELSDSVSKILYAICDKGEGCSLQTIIRYTDLSKQTVNSALRKLESDEIIYLEAINAKSKKVYLTDKGKQLVKHTAERMLQIEDKIFASWEKEDVKRYLKFIERYLTDLKEEIKTL